MYLRYLLGLFFISLIFPIIYSVLLMPVLGLALGGMAAKEHGAAGKALSVPLLAASIVAQVYIFCGWAAYAAVRTILFTRSPSVTHDWLYYITGFFTVTAPLGYMASKEPEHGGPGATLYTTAVGVVFVVFCIWPHLMEIPYGWFLHWIYG